MSDTRLLYGIDCPADLRKLPRESIEQIAEEIRREILERVSQTGGHLASSLGAVELITALHYVFDTPNDRVVFDVGHQGYPHKMLTGRRDQFESIGQLDGISKFLRRSESLTTPLVPVTRGRQSLRHSEWRGGCGIAGKTISRLHLSATGQ